MTSVTITEVTDPFCTWCWGAEPLLRRLEETYRDQVDFEFVMGGLVEDFDTFRDGANDITDPQDVAPHWEDASERHGMPVDAAVWRENPPQSSYPASIAYEAAELRDESLAHDYLRRLREAVTVERRDISQESVLLDLADGVGLGADSFVDAFRSDTARERFEADRQFARNSRASAFPSFRVEANDEVTWIRGFQGFDALRDALNQVAPGLREYDSRPIPEFIGDQRRVATQEVATVYGMSPGRTMQALRSLEDENVVSSVRMGNGYFWRTSAPSADNSLPENSDTRPMTPRGGRCSLDGDCTFDS